MGGAGVNGRGRCLLAGSVVCAWRLLDTDAMPALGSVNDASKSAACSLPMPPPRRRLHLQLGEYRFRIFGSGFANMFGDEPVDTPMLHLFRNLQNHYGAVSRRSD